MSGGVEGAGLLPCPFCGGGARLNERMRTQSEMKGAEYQGYFVHCCNINCFRPTTTQTALAVAIEAWNTRALSPQTLPAPGEELEFAWRPASVLATENGEALATVAAANNEAFARGVEAAAKVVDAEYNLRKAHHTANKESGNKKETRDFETMMIAHTQSAAVIRLLSQGEKA